MGKRNYDETSVVLELGRTHGIEINKHDKSIQIMKTVPFGNGTWGKIDFLCNYCGYLKYLVDTIEKPQREVKAKEETPEVDAFLKKKKRINMAGIAKTAMGKVKAKFTKKD